MPTQSQAAPFAAFTKPDGSSDPRKVLPVFAGLLVAMIMAALDQTVFATALPTIVGELHGVSMMLWVTTAYILASTLTMPVYGKLGDLLGHRTLFLTAIGLFLAGSILGALANNMPLLIAGRAVQGLGGGGLMILTMSIIALIVAPRERGKYSGILGGAFAAPSVIGPVLGGWFAEGIGWRWAFWMNIPMAIFAFVVAFKSIPHLNRSTKKPHVDYMGMSLLMTAAAAVVMATTLGGSTYPWLSAPIITLFVVGAVCAVVLVYVERLVPEPVMPLFLFRDKNFNLVTIAGLVIGIAMFGAIAYVPTYMQMVTGKSATISGLLMIPMMAGMLVMSTIMGQVMSRARHYKWIPLVGTVVIGFAMLLLGTMTVDTVIWHICVYLAILGAGLGMCMQTLVLIVQNQFALKEVGTATATKSFFQQTGAALGSALVGNVFVTSLMNNLHDKLPSGTEIQGGFEALTPEIVDKMPEAVRHLIVTAYSESLAPVYLWIIPFVVVAFILLCFLWEKPLNTAVPTVQSPDDSGGNRPPL